MKELVHPHPYSFPTSEIQLPRLDQLFLIEQEKIIWEEKVLGGKVRMVPLPQEVTQTVYKELNRYGFSLVAIPGLDIDFSYLQQHTVHEFLTDIAVYYPQWLSLESLKDHEYRLCEKHRNMSGWFWQRVKDGNIPFPSFEPSWIAVETFQKPSCGISYPHTLAGDCMGYQDTERSSSSFHQIGKAIQQHKADILTDSGLSCEVADMRLPTASELNLLGNRLHLGNTNSNEWVSTLYYLPNGKVVPLFMGSSDIGGVGGVGWYCPDEPREDIGFRLVVEFKNRYTT